MSKLLLSAGCAILISSVLPHSACAEVIYQTDDPFGGPFGLIGFDVCSTQSVALRFQPAGEFTLDTISLWYMNNDFSGKLHPTVTITLRNDEVIDGASNPGQEIFESWKLTVSAVGWDPVLEELSSEVHPLLHDGQRYWIVCESAAECGLDGVWNWASSGLGFMSICNGSPCEWQSGQGAVAATIVEGTPLPLWDINHDGKVGPADLAALLASWGKCPGEPCAADFDADGSVGPGDLAQLLAHWS